MFVLSECPVIPIVVDPSIALALIVSPFLVSCSSSGTNIPVSKFDSVTKVSVVISLIISTSTVIVYNELLCTLCMAVIV